MLVVILTIITGLTIEVAGGLLLALILHRRFQG